VPCLFRQLLVQSSTPVQAGEAEARALLKAMSDYMVSQKAISFSYDTGLEVVTSEKQKIMLASSGTMNVSRPDKIRVNRTGGFADVEFVYDARLCLCWARTRTSISRSRNPAPITSSLMS